MTCQTARSEPKISALGVKSSFCVTKIAFGGFVAEILAGEIARGGLVKDISLNSRLHV